MQFPDTEMHNLAEKKKRRPVSGKKNSTILNND